MKNKLIGTIAACLLLFMARPLHARVAFYGDLVNTQTQAASTPTYALDTDTPSGGINSLSAQIVVSSAAPPAGTFTDGAAATGSISVINFPALMPSKATGTIVVVTNSASSGSYATDTILVASNPALIALGTNTFVMINGTSYYANKDFMIGVSSYATAINLVNFLQNIQFGITASTAVTGTTVKLTLSQYGSSYNSYTMSSSSPAALTVGSANFTNGRDPALLRVAGVSLLNGPDWTTALTSSGTAKALCDAINLRSALTSILVTTTAFSASLDATSATVIMTAVSTGTAYHYDLYTSTQFALRVSGIPSTSTGSATGSIASGRDAGVLSVNGTRLRAGIEFQAVTSSATTAKNISNAIQANAYLASLLQSTWTTGGVVQTTASKTGTYYALSLYTSTQSALALNVPVTTAADGSANGSMQGGSSSKVTASVITIAAHGYGTGLAVLYSTTSGSAFSPLVNQTTYYIIAVDANNVRLATTAVQAIAGAYITLSAGSANTPQTATKSYALTPLGMTGLAVMTWEYSNDGTNWSTLSTNSASMSSTMSATSTQWDFGAYNYKWVRMRQSGLTTGQISQRATLNGKN